MQGAARLYLVESIEQIKIPGVEVIGRGDLNGFISLSAQKSRQVLVGGLSVQHVWRKKHTAGGRGFARVD